MKNGNHSHSLIQEVNTVSFVAFVKCVQLLFAYYLVENN